MAPDDVPRDFGPVVAFSDTCREAVRERNVGPQTIFIYLFIYFFKSYIEMQ